MITGASRGIGAACASSFAAAGYAVCVNYQAAQQAAEDVVGSIRSNGGKAIAVQGDVSVPEQVDALFKRCDQELGTLDILVNNAGISSPRSRVEDLPLDALHHIININVIGLIHCSQHAIRRMSTHRGGRGGAIINISSGSAYIGNPHEGVHYAVSKGAVNSFTIGLSQEVASEGIRVNTVSPGLTRTDMPNPAKLEEMAPRIPMGRIGEAQEIAEAVLWLASEQASYVAGANIRVAGGRP